MDGVVLGVVTQPRTHDHQPPSRSSQGRPPQRAVAQAMHQRCTGMFTQSSIPSDRAVPTVTGPPSAPATAAMGILAACTCMDMGRLTACILGHCHWQWFCQPGRTSGSTGGNALCHCSRRSCTRELADRTAIPAHHLVASKSTMCDVGLTWRLQSVALALAAWPEWHTAACRLSDHEMIAVTCSVSVSVCQCVSVSVCQSTSCTP